MTTPSFDTGAARTLALTASQTPTAGHTLDRAALITTILDACTEVERLRAALAVAERAASLCAGEVAELRRAAAPTRGDLSVAYNSACARRVEAEEAFQRARAAAARSTAGRQAEVYYDADQRLRAAVEDEAAKRAALDAFERANGLDLTHPDAVEPCPGSRGW